MTLRDSVLVTGTAGHVGSETVARLVKRGHKVIALTHDRAEIISNNGHAVTPARVLKGDICEPGLGLDRSDIADLASKVLVVVHCAAATDFGLPEQQYTELNIEGTANVIDLARQCGAGLLHLSTVYVCGEIDEVFREDQLDLGQQFGNDYESSKFRAEELVRASDIDWIVVRPGIVSGEHRTGYSRAYKHMYQIVKLIVEGKLRTLPGNYATTLALSPIGHVADTIVAAVENFAHHIGYTFHAVGADAVSLQLMSDILAEYPSLLMADLVPPSSFHPDDLDDIERAYFLKVGSLYTTYLRRRTGFDSTNTYGRLGIKPPSVGGGYLRRLFDSCLQTGYFNTAEPTIEDVLASLQLSRNG